MEIQTIAKIHSPFGTKFGIPRQSGLAETLQSRIVFEPAYRKPEALRGLETFSHLWLLWGFSENAHDGWSPTVRPPRLGGNERIGVFATRSPFRPNPLGLSCVKLETIHLHTSVGPVIGVSGADLMDGTPIFDIKPYLPYADCHPGAKEGFAPRPERRLDVVYSPNVNPEVLGAERAALEDVLRYDPRPPYHHDPERVYGMTFADREIRFSVCGTILTVLDITETRPATTEKPESHCLT